MLIANKFNGYRRDGRRLYFLDFGGDAPPPPDYTPVAQASKEAAEISAALGREQLAEAQRQYDQNMAVAQPVVNTQLQIMQQGLRQGNDYYNYQQNFRPLEQAMLANITGMSSADVDKVNTLRSEAVNTAKTTWQQQQDARMAELQQQIAAAQAQEAQAAQQAAAQRSSGTQFYIDAQGNVKSADAYRGLTQADPKQAARNPFLGLAFGMASKSPGDGYSYYQYESDEPGMLGSIYKPGVWLKTADVPGGAPAAQDPATLRSTQLQAELDKLRQQQFDQSGVDLTGVNQEAQRLMMAGMQAKTQADKAEIDAITGEVKANAGELMARTKAYEQEAASDIKLFTGGNQGIADKYRADIDADVGTAMADARQGQTQALNTAARQAARYGLVVPSNVQTLTNQNAAQLAAAANNTRSNSINQYRNLVGQGIGLKQGAFTTGQAATMDAMAKQEGASQQGRNMRIQSDSLNWAKQLDVAGMARGMPGASQGAYGVAVGAGNSATQSQMAPGQALIGAMGQSNATQMQGLNTQMQGLTSVLGAQGQYAGQVSAANSSRNNAMLDVVGTGLGLAFSDVRLKRDIVKVGDDPRGFGWYEFRYVGQSERVRGVMAHEVQAIVPEAVTTVGGYQAVFYNLL